MMRTQDEIVARIKTADSFFGFDKDVWSRYLDIEHMKPLCKDDADLSDWTPKPLTVSQIVADMGDYMAFAWEKALDHRGISAIRSVEKMGAWLWLLGDDQLQLFIREHANYAPYGAPILTAICDKYGFPIPEGEMAERMGSGRPCSDNCDDCLG